jgi:hypothetical protein
MQTIFPTEEEPLRGNCFQACIASLFELPLEAVPNFCMEGEWPTNLEQWLAGRGLAAIDVRLDTRESVIYPVAAGVKCLIAGTTDRHSERLHCVVAETRGNGLTWEYLHDPHPAGRFIERPSVITFFAVVEVRP